MRRVIAGLSPWVLLAVLGSLPANATEPSSEPSSETPPDPAELIQQINDAYEQGQYQRAAQLLEQAYQADPQPSLLYSMGEALVAAEDYEGARRAFERFLDTDPPSVDADAARDRIAQCEEHLVPPPVDEGPVEVTPVDTTPVDTTPPAEDTPPRTRRVDGVFVGLLVAGAVMSGTGAGLLAGARVAIDRTREPSTEDAWERDIDRSRGLATVGTVALGIGGTLLVSAALRAILVRRSPRARGTAQAMTQTMTRHSAGPMWPSGAWMVGRRGRGPLR